MSASPSLASVNAEHDDGYPDLERMVRDAIAKNQETLFTTDFENVFETFLANLPFDRIQHYRCHACRRFLDKYGSLVTIDADGVKASLLWDESYIFPPLFQEVARVIQKRIHRAKVTGVFLSEEKVWGTPVTGNWTHLSGTPMSRFVARKKNAEQEMANLKEEFGILTRSLAEFTDAHARVALSVLESDSLSRADKTLDLGKWLVNVYERLAKSPNRQTKVNLTWKIAAAAPAGWNHIKTTMIGTLLSDIKEGLPFSTIKRNWDVKMHPTKYMRPVAPPKEGAIANAEKLVEKLGVARSLERRFAVLEEVEAFWKPVTWAPPTQPSGGVFGHLKQQPVVPHVELPPRTMTWVKFWSEILPRAKKLDVLTPIGKGSFFQLIGPVHPDSPNILRWDNRYSWQFYVNGSYAHDFNLHSNEWVKVNAICEKPTHWGPGAIEKYTQESRAAFLVLDNCRDTKVTAGSGLFPEILGGDYHEIRSVIEAHSNKTRLQGAEFATACGLAIQAKGSVPTRLRVDHNEVFIIDRWD